MGTKLQNSFPLLWPTHTVSCPSMGSLPAPRDRLSAGLSTCSCSEEAHVALHEVSHPVPCWGFSLPSRNLLPSCCWSSEACSGVRAFKNEPHFPVTHCREKLWSTKATFQCENPKWSTSVLEQKGQVYAENPQSLSQMGQLWLVLALFIGVRQMEKKPHLCRGPCVLNLLLIHAILSVEDALQSNTKWGSPALVLKTLFRPL